MTYNKAPIIEASIDLRVILPERTDLSKVNKLIKNDYPREEAIDNNTTTIRLEKQHTTVSTAHQNIGYKLSAADGKFIAQIKNNGFTFNILENYKNWEDFHAEANRIWKIYCEELAPIRVSRVALRYINRIDIPASKFNLEEYFNTYPHVFKNNTADLSALFMQVQIPQSEGGIAILNQTATNPPSPGYTSILLDIDVFDLKNFKPNDKELWERIELLRKQKNIIFEESITDKTRELFS